MILAGWVVAAVAAAWMGIAHTVGAAFRVVGRSARDLDPLHRRDGLGLAALVAAIIAAVATWWQVTGPVRPLGTGIHTLFGSGSWAVPLLLGLLAWRFLRHPDSNADTARMVIGWIALLLGVLGLIHVASGTPGMTHGLAPIRSAGGLIGYVASAPLASLLTKWAAIPILALVAGFGLLVITGTPLHRVPDRVAELHGYLSRRPARLAMGTMAKSSGRAARRPGSAAGRPTRWRSAPTTGPTTRRSSAVSWAGGIATRTSLLPTRGLA